jgi:hypothetical protein
MSLDPADDCLGSTTMSDRTRYWSSARHNRWYRKKGSTICSTRHATVLTRLRVSVSSVIALPISGIGTIADLL